MFKQIPESTIINNAIALVGQQLSSNKDSLINLATQLINVAISITFYGSIHWKILQCRSDIITGKIIEEKKDEKGNTIYIYTNELRYIYDMTDESFTSKIKFPMFNIIGLVDKATIYQIQGQYLYANTSTIQLLYMRGIQDTDAEAKSYFNLVSWMQRLLEYNLALLLAPNIGLTQVYYNNLSIQLEKLTLGAYYQDKTQDNFSNSQNIFQKNLNHYILPEIEL
jgi:hypothetical protein